MKKFSGIFLLLFAVLGYAQKCSCPSVKELTSVKISPIYEKHISASKKFNIKLLTDGKTLSGYRENGKLTKVKPLGKGYRIENLQYSKPLLVPQAKLTLKDIAKNFNAKTKGSTITLTSLTRTLEDQCKLRKVNGNAAQGISSHNYGNSFDVSYVRFNDRLERNARLEKTLETILKDYEKQGKIYYIKENQQSCFHVTVRS